MRQRGCFSRRASKHPTLTTAPGRSEVVLDLSRLLSRVRHEAPTGVDRVEFAYACELLRQVPERVTFGARHPVGGFYGRLSRDAVTAFLGEIAARWRDGAPGWRNRRREHARLLWSLRLHRVPPPRMRRVFLQVSPTGLDDEMAMRRILHRERAQLICLLHDLIPIAFPEYARAGGDVIHRRRIAAVARLASGIVANSQATLDAFRHFTGAAGRDLPAVVAHLGLDTVPAAAFGGAPAEPYFLSVGTIEARKNHLLLLHAWRAMAKTRPRHTIPKLVLIGRRGWENEQVVDLLERCQELRGLVEERGRVSDSEMARLLGQASAMLLPSFAEGYGMPLAEALAAGIPVLCSDLPAFREVGAAVPDYLDPLDGPAWIAAVLDYAQPGSPRRAAQLARMAAWREPSWADHIATAVAMIDRIA